MNREDLAVGQKVYWICETGWARGRTAHVLAEIVKINPKKIRIKVWRRLNRGETKEEFKNVYPSSLKPRV